jgi:hypothetical protein
MYHHHETPYSIYFLKSGKYFNSKVIIIYVLKGCNMPQNMKTITWSWFDSSHGFIPRFNLILWVVLINLYRSTENKQENIKWENLK